MQARLADLSELLARAARHASASRPDRIRHGPSDDTAPSRRRAFLRRLRRGRAAAAVVGGLGGSRRSRTSRRPPTAAPTVTVPGYIPFGGDHQAGIVRPARPQNAAIFVALDAVVGSRPELVMALGELTTRIRQLTAGWAPEPATRCSRRPTAGSSARRSARPT